MSVSGAGGPLMDAAGAPVRVGGQIGVASSGRAFKNNQSTNFSVQQ